MTLPYDNPQSYQQWAQDLESYDALPQTPQETAIISAWEQSENPVNQVGSYTKAGGYNALNTSLMSGSSGLEPGSTFIPVYPTALAGIQATSETLAQSNFSPELTALKNQSGPALIAALGNPSSIWGSNPATVSQILGEGASTSIAGAGTAAAAETTPPGGTSPAVTLTGFGAILQALDSVMNPTPPDTTATPAEKVLNVLTLGLYGAATSTTTDILATVEGLVVRGMFSAAFVGILYFGVKALGSSSGGTSTSIVNQIQGQQRIGQENQRLDIARTRTSQAQQRIDQGATREKRIASGTKASTVNKTKKTAKAASGGVTAAATDALETVGEAAAL